MHILNNYSYLVNYFLFVFCLFNLLCYVSYSQVVLRTRRTSLEPITFRLVQALITMHKPFVHVCDPP